VRGFFVSTETWILILNSVAYVQQKESVAGWDRKLGGLGVRAWRQGIARQTAYLPSIIRTEHKSTEKP
jgi:hypothetical protein